MSNTIEAITLNVYKGTDPSAILRTLSGRNIQGRGVDLGVMQESGDRPNRDVSHVLKVAKFDTYVHGEYRTFWNPSAFVGIRHFNRRLSNTPWYAKGSKEPYFSEAAFTILCDFSGRTILLGSAHLPSHIQPKDAPDNRIQAAVESFRRLDDIAENSLCDAVIIGMDINFDPDTGVEKAVLKQAMYDGTLRPLVTDKPTQGPREIDFLFLKRGGALRNESGMAWTAPGPGDHKIKGHRLAWTRKG